jgi:hypothetical protein
VGEGAVVVTPLWLLALVPLLWVCVWSLMRAARKADDAISGFAQDMAHRAPGAETDSFTAQAHGDTRRAQAALRRVK